MITCQWYANRRLSRPKIIPVVRNLI